MGPGYNGSVTDSHGYFEVSGPPGPAVLELSAGNYLGNDSVIQVPNGTILDFGGVLLIHYGYVEGELRGSDPTHEFIPPGSLRITTSSRDQTITGQSGEVGANGSFFLEVPPMPDDITFTPPPGNILGPYLPNATFVDPPPNVTVNLGTIYVPTGTRLNVHLVDLSTGLPISPLPSLDISACVLDTGICPFQTIDHDNSSVYALPGLTQLQVLLAGYLENYTDIGMVSPVPSGTAVNLTVGLIPDAVIVFETNVTGGIPESERSGSLGLVQSCSYNNLLQSFVNPQIVNFSPQYVVPGICTIPWFGTWGSFDDFTSDQMAFVPPMRSDFHLYSHLWNVPLYYNDTYLNTTPGEVLNIGEVNYTPGGWVEGHVVIAGSHSGPWDGFSVRVCSTDTTWCGDGSQTSGDCGNSSSPQYLACGGCPGSTDNSSFCTSAPYGPDLLKVSAPGYGSNWTWIEIPRQCCNSGSMEPLTNVTDPRVDEINVSAAGSAQVFGKVMERFPDGSVSTPAQLAITICPVSPSTTDQNCLYSIDGEVLLGGDGSFSAVVSEGWQSITASGWQADQNGTWVDAVSNNSTGTIWLVPYASVVGTAESPSGTPVAGAYVSICPVSQPACNAPLGSGVTSSGGLFYGTVPSGPFPSNAYQVYVTAAGYSDGSAWVNVTTGFPSTIGVIRLTPTGIPSRAPEGPETSVNSGTSWVDGFVVVNGSDSPLWDYNLEACAILTGGCTSVFLGSPTADGGEFNGSLPNGPTTLSISRAGFVASQLYANLTGAPLNFGRIALDPWPRLSGRIAFGPWSEPTFQYGMGPNGADLKVCDSAFVVCGPSSRPDSGGFFSIAGPEGLYDTLSIYPVSTTFAVESPGPGLTSSVLDVSLSPGGSALNQSRAATPTLDLYSVLSGRIGDASTYDSGLGKALEPVPLAYIIAQTASNGLYRATLSSTPGGLYHLLVPPGESIVINFSAEAFWHNQVIVSAPRGSGSLALGEVDLLHYGWVTGEVEQQSPRAGLPFAGLTAAVYDVANGTEVTSTGAADASGYVNLTAPFGSSVVVTASLPGYNSTYTTVQVLESETTPFDLPPLAGSGLVWVASEEVNTVGRPPKVTLQDPVAHQPVGLASLFVSGASGATLNTPIKSNALGQFLVATTFDANLSVTFTKPEYSPLTVQLPPYPGVYRYSMLNMTGEGVVAGFVFDEGSGLAINDVAVVACSFGSNPTCRTVNTNLSGDFWLSMPPGLVSISFSSSTFVGNQSYDLSLCSDCFIELPSIPLWRDSEVRGTVITSPTGDLLEGAGVSFCTVGTYVGVYCVNSITTDPLGEFFLDAPAGSYLLNVTYEGYAPSSFEVATSPGELVDVGTIVLYPNGTLSGDVIAANTGLPLANASVSACPNSGESGCESALTGLGGNYSFLVAAGPYTVTASYPGYYEAAVTVLALTGERVGAPPLDLLWDGPGQEFPVQGFVGSGPNGALPVANATISAFQATSLLARASTGSSGDFELLLAWGSYTLVVAADGFRAVRIPITVHGSIEGVDSNLEPFPWTVAGRVENAYNGAGIPAAELLIRGTVRATADGMGMFSFGLPNGTYSFTAEAGPANSGLFSTSRQTVEVQGGPVNLTIPLPLSAMPVALTALDGSTGMNLVGALLSVNGTLEIRGTYNGSWTSGPNGWALADLPLGQYTLKGSDAGYGEGTTTFTVQNGTVEENVTLPRLWAGTSAETPWATVGLGILLLAAVAIVTIGGYRQQRGRRLATSRPDTPSSS
jgi:hypothetical protein